MVPLGAQNSARLHGIFTARLHNDVVPFFLDRTLGSFRIFLPTITLARTFFHCACVNFRSSAAGDPVSRGRHRRRRQKSSHIATGTKKNITPSTGGTKKKLSRGSLSVNEKRTDFSLLIALHTHTHDHTYARTYTHSSHRQSNAHPTTGPTTSRERDTSNTTLLQQQQPFKEPLKSRKISHSKLPSIPVGAVAHFRPSCQHSQTRTERIMSRLNALGPTKNYFTLCLVWSGSNERTTDLFSRMIFLSFNMADLASEMTAGVTGEIP